MIPQGRMSTDLVESYLPPPESLQQVPLISFELGPIAVGDTSEGLVYQTWIMTWVANDLIATPQTTGSPVTVLTIPNLTFLNFTFDQNGRITVTYIDNTSSYLYWFDTSLGMTVTTDLGTDVLTPYIHLDDKRTMQSAVNDMLLWYLKVDGGTHELFMALQRERFLTNYSMATGIVGSKIHKLGMAGGLRLQFQFVA